MNAKKIIYSSLSLVVFAAAGLSIMQPVNASAFGTVQLSPSFTQTYIATSTFYTPPSSAGNIFWSHYGSSSKVVRILNISISRVASGSGADQYALTKRSSAISGGSGASISSVPVDSANAAATGVVTQYTAAPTAGANVGLIGSNVTAQTAVAANQSLYQCGNLEQALTLRGTSQGVDLAGVTALTGTIQVTEKYQESTN